MIYRAYNVTRKEYVQGTLRDVGSWLSALLCNDLQSASVGRWSGDRIVVQGIDARPTSYCPSFVKQRDLRDYTDITLVLRLTPSR